MPKRSTTESKDAETPEPPIRGEGPSDGDSAERLIELFRTLKRFFRQEVPLDADQGVSEEKLRLLAALRFLGRSRLKDLAAYDGLSASSQCILAGQLANEGLVIRSEDPGDRRNVFYELSESGLGLVDGAVAGRLDRIRAKLKAVADADRLRFDEALRTVLTTTRALAGLPGSAAGELRE